jgi:ArsR family transcriptional regulator, arsenate/arsenite/antimonite-responsive transcriptional repressor
METSIALEALQALSQETRLAALRLLVQAGPNGLPAGFIADRLAVQPSTLSTHLGILERAGLVASRRQSRHIYYAAQFDGLRQLIAFMMEDCCQGRAEICGGLVPTQQAACGPSACAPKGKAARSLAPAHSINPKRK